MNRNSSEDTLARISESWTTMWYVDFARISSCNLLRESKRFMVTCRSIRCIIMLQFVSLNDCDTSFKIIWRMGKEMRDKFWSKLLFSKAWRIFCKYDGTKILYSLNIINSFLQNQQSILLHLRAETTILKYFCAPNYEHISDLCRYILKWFKLGNFPLSLMRISKFVS